MYAFKYASLKCCAVCSAVNVRQKFSANKLQRFRLFHRGRLSIGEQTTVVQIVPWGTPIYS